MISLRLFQIFKILFVSKELAVDYANVVPYCRLRQNWSILDDCLLLGVSYNTTRSFFWFGSFASTLDPLCERGAPAEPFPSPKYVSLQLPYLDSISNNIWQELSSFIRHKAVVNVKLRCFQSTRKLQSWFSAKDRQALLNRFNVVYKLTCSCGASYIGQTQRNAI